MLVTENNAKAFDVNAFTVSKQTVLDKIHSTFHWRKAIKWDRRWSHRERDIEMFSINNELWMLILHEDQNQDYLVVDMVNPDYTPGQVKQMLDDGVSTADICTLSNTTFFNKDQKYGESVFPSVTWIIDQLKQN